MKIQRANNADSRDRGLRTRKSKIARDVILHARIKPLRWHCMALALALPTFRPIQTTRMKETYNLGH
jgi:hypothetical protein